MSPGGWLRDGEMQNEGVQRSGMHDPYATPCNDAGHTANGCDTPWLPVLSQHVTCPPVYTHVPRSRCALTTSKSWSNTPTTSVCFQGTTPSSDCSDWGEQCAASARSHSLARTEKTARSFTTVCLSPSTDVHTPRPQCQLAHLCNRTASDGRSWTTPAFPRAPPAAPGGSAPGARWAAAQRPCCLPRPGLAPLSSGSGVTSPPPPAPVRRRLRSTPPGSAR